MVVINEPDALWVYGAGVLILLVAYGRTRLPKSGPAPEPRIMPSSSNKNPSVSES
jgi:hypothetical protein